MYSETNHGGLANKNKEELILAGRLSDLADACYKRNIPVFSSFLNLNEQNILYNMKKSFSYVCESTDGGFEYAVRRIAVFLPYEGCELCRYKKIP